jgi:heme O synthase-like polyprenyltransferase
MEEQIKTTLPDLDGDKKEEDKDTVKYLMYIFIPIIIIILLCFRYNTLRLIVLSLSGLFLCYTSYKTYKEKKQKLQKEIFTQSNNKAK